MNRRAKEPLVLHGCTELLEMTGAWAGDVGELLDGIADASPASIFYHTHGFILQHHFIPPSFINEFAKWAFRDLNVPALSEKLAGVDPADFPDVENLRWELVRILDEYVRESHIVPRVIHGQPFYFLQAWIQTVPTGQSASTLSDLRECVRGADHGSIYYHLVETRRTLNEPGGEIGRWLRKGLGLHRMADRVAGLDTFMYSLEGLRGKLLELLENEEEDE